MATSSAPPSTLQGPTIIQFFPGFSVDFKQFDTTSHQKSKPIISLAIQALKELATAYARAVYLTLANSGTSFKYIVLGYYSRDKYSVRLPENYLYLIVLKTVLWMLGMGWGILATTHRFYWEKHLDTASLENFSGGQIDVSHIRTKQLTLDTSAVPEDITINSLADAFAKINFTDPTKPGYRKNHPEKLTTEKLKKNLDTYIKNIDERKPITGTPPAHDTLRLFPFYQQLEDLTRLSLHKVTKELQEFLDQNGNDETRYSVAQNQQYLNLLEDRDRVVIDLAVAGGHCGARYMGDALGTYSRLHGNALGSAETLEDNLIETLAFGRKQLAEGLAEEEASLPGNDAHSYTNYMASLGKLLAIPGTENVIEHLSTPLHVNLHLGRFFKKYTVNYILGKIQEKAKKSNIFREQIIDWIKSHAGDWNKGAYPVPEGQLERVKDALSEPCDVSQETADIKEFVKDAKSKVSELNGLDWAQLTDKLIYHLNLDKWDRTKKDRIQTLLSVATLGNELTEQLKKTIFGHTTLDTAALEAKLIQLQKVQKVRAIVPLEPDTIVRMSKEEVDVKEALESYQDQLRASAFFRQFNVQNMHEQGIPTPLLEWLVVSHRILLPQSEPKTTVTLAPSSTFRRSIINLGYADDPSILSVDSKQLSSLFDQKIPANRKEEIAENLSGQRTTRYQFYAVNKRQRYLTTIFEQVYAQKPQEVITTFEKYYPQEKPLYPAWKNITLIVLPKKLADLTGSWLFKQAFSTVALYAISALALAPYNKAMQGIGPVLSIFINKTPIQVIRAGNTLLNLKDYALSIFLYIKITQYVATKLLPPIRYPGVESVSRLWAIFDEFFFIRINSLDASFIFGLPTKVSDAFRAISEHSERKKIAQCKKKIANAWIASIV